MKREFERGGSDDSRYSFKRPCFRRNDNSHISESILNCNRLIVRKLFQDFDTFVDRLQALQLNPLAKLEVLLWSRDIVVALCVSMQQEIVIDKRSFIVCLQQLFSFFDEPNNNFGESVFNAIQNGFCLEVAYMLTVCCESINFNDADEVYQRKSFMATLNNTFSAEQMRFMEEFDSSSIPVGNNNSILDNIAFQLQLIDKGKPLFSTHAQCGSILQSLLSRCRRFTTLPSLGFSEMLVVFRGEQLCCIYPDYLSHLQQTISKFIEMCESYLPTIKEVNPKFPTIASALEQYGFRRPKDRDLALEAINNIRNDLENGQFSSASELLQRCIKFNSNLPADCITVRGLIHDVFNTKCRRNRNSSYTASMKISDSTKPVICSYKQQLEPHLSIQSHQQRFENHRIVETEQRIDTNSNNNTNSNTTDNDNNNIDNNNDNNNNSNNNSLVDHSICSNNQQSSSPSSVAKFDSTSSEQTEMVQESEPLVSSHSESADNDTAIFPVSEIENVSAHTAADVVDKIIAVPNAIQNAKIKKWEKFCQQLPVPVTIPQFLFPRLPVTMKADKSVFANDQRTMLSKGVPSPVIKVITLFKIADSKDIKLWLLIAQALNASTEDMHKAKEILLPHLKESRNIASVSQSTEVTLSRPELSTLQVSSAVQSLPQQQQCNTLSHGFHSMAKTSAVGQQVPSISATNSYTATSQLPVSIGDSSSVRLGPTNAFPEMVNNNNANVSSVGTLAANTLTTFPNSNHNGFGNNSSSSLYGNSRNSNSSSVSVTPNPIANNSSSIYYSSYSKNCGNTGQSTAATAAVPSTGATVTGPNSLSSQNMPSFLQPRALLTSGLQSTTTNASTSKSAGPFLQGIELHDPVNSKIYRISVPIPTSPMTLKDIEELFCKSASSEIIEYFCKVALSKMIPSVPPAFQKFLYAYARTKFDLSYYGEFHQAIGASGINLNNESLYKHYCAHFDTMLKGAIEQYVHHLIAEGKLPVPSNVPEAAFRSVNNAPVQSNCSFTSTTPTAAATTAFSNPPPYPNVQPNQSFAWNPSQITMPGASHPQPVIISAAIFPYRQNTQPGVVPHPQQFASLQHPTTSFPSTIPQYLQQPSPTMYQIHPSLTTGLHQTASLACPPVQPQPIPSIQPLIHHPHSKQPACQQLQPPPQGWNPPQFQQKQVDDSKDINSTNHNNNNYYNNNINHPVVTTDAVTTIATQLSKPATKRSRKPRATASEKSASDATANSMDAKIMKLLMQDASLWSAQSTLGGENHGEASNNENSGDKSS